MSKKILIAGNDENFLMLLAVKFYKELDENVELNVITDYILLTNYTNRDFEKEDILIIDSSYYTNEVDYKNYNMIVLLDKNPDKAYSGGFISINKYSNVDYIYDCITNKTFLGELAEKYNKKNTKIIAVYSPIGGSGKTVIGYGICFSLSKAYKKALYINMGNLQDFGYLFNNVSFLPSKYEKAISNNDEDIVDELNELILNEQFDFIRPLRMSMSSLGITENNYINMLSLIKEKNIYDYIVVDLSNDFNAEMAEIISTADKVVCVCEQDYMSATRIDRLIDNLDISDSDKYLFLCNKYNTSSTNYLIGNILKNIITIKDYIEYMPYMKETKSIDKGFLKKIEQITVLFM